MSPSLQTETVPCLPETAPFTPEQRAYLNGFLAGLFSRRPAPTTDAAPVTAPAARPLLSLTVLFGSQTGNAERLAKRIAKEAGQRGFAATVHDLAAYPPERLASEHRLLLVASTYGDGDPPDSAQTFWQALSREAAPRLVQTRFSVCALGDSNYAQFCGFGKAVDARLAALGATRLHPRVDCDVEFEDAFRQWLQGALGALADTQASAASHDPAPALAGLVATLSDPPAEPPGYRREWPVPATFLSSSRLNGPGSAKDTRHIVFSLADSGPAYEAGDVLGVMPSNDPDLVADILNVLDCRGEEPVAAGGGTLPLREALLGHYDLTRIAPALLKVLAERTGDATLAQLARPGANGELTAFLRGRELIDLLRDCGQAARFTAAEFVGQLKKLQPRCYSIASSPKSHPGEVHLTVGVVRYESHGRRRQGVCSTFLGDRVVAGGRVPVFVQRNPRFRLPADGERPILMVGPGTGLAPFRAFLQERQATGATGRNWLFFGGQHAGTDFLYREELEAFQQAGLLTRLDTAFSRDQAEKLYVQHRMLAQARELFAWLEDGAFFYVCGDASRMAKDVDAALHRCIEAGGGLGAEQAAAYVTRLQSEGRYLRDVY